MPLVLPSSDGLESQGPVALPPDVRHPAPDPALLKPRKPLRPVCIGITVPLTATLAQHSDFGRAPKDAMAKSRTKDG
jgi:hypothetical protein